ncbi:hypothetical protein BD410DRAFT_895512 [Rickenella mellea]|uniref:Smr domain-containing protein n=1 Tax=Rickenella mellea TaxID=50990 RepID=A0A4Y7QFV8_9AGAM|nr:hypothetical protein BD410DRAFT_895512 [Rickenella mellea]
MDSLVAIISGIAMRVSVSMIFGQSLKVAALLTGLWDGILLHRSMRRTKYRSSDLLSDPYLQAAFAVLFELTMNRSLLRIVVVSLGWCLGVVLADVGPAIWYDIGGEDLPRELERLWYDLSRSLSLNDGTRHTLFLEHPRRSSSSASSSTTVTPPSPTVYSAWQDSLPDIPGTYRPSRFRPRRPFPSTSSHSSQLHDIAEDDTEEGSAELTPRASPNAISPLEDIHPIDHHMSEPAHLSPSDDDLYEKDSPITPPPTQPNYISVPITELPTIPTPGDEVPPKSPALKPQDPLTPITPLPTPGLADAQRNSIPKPMYIPNDESPIAGPSSATLRTPRRDYTIDDETATNKSESIIFDGPTSEMVEMAQETRKEADAALAKLHELQSRRVKAAQNKDHWEVFALKHETLKVVEDLNRLHRKAEKTFYKAYNPAEKPARIDVHGLKVKEAIKQTERKLREVQLSGGKKLEVITGRGRHSKNGIPVLKVSVMQALNSQGIPVEVDSRNPGLLNIAIP